jgi:uncharacterized ferredoxin-like protein
LQVEEARLAANILLITARVAVDEKGESELEVQEEEEEREEEILVDGVEEVNSTHLNNTNHPDNPTMLMTCQ